MLLICVYIIDIFSVPEDVLSIDGQVETSYDSYNQAAVIDLTNSEQPIEEIDNTIIDLRTDDALSGRLLIPF